MFYLLRRDRRRWLRQQKRWQRESRSKKPRLEGLALDRKINQQATNSPQAKTVLELQKKKEKSRKIKSDAGPLQKRLREQVTKYDFIA